MRSVALHFVAQCHIDQISHCLGRRLFAVSRIGSHDGLRIKDRGRGIEIRRIHKLHYALRSGSSRQCLVHGDLQLFFNFFLQLVDALLVEDSLAQQKHLGTRNRITSRIPLALGIWTI